MKQKILIIFPKDRDKRELSAFKDKYDLHFHDYNISAFRSFIYQKRAGTAITPQKLMDDVITYIKKHQINGIISTDDYPGSLFQSIIAKEVGFIAPSPQSVVLCQHKYLSRKTQKKHVPHATPNAYFITAQCKDELQSMPSFPFFIKPVKACFSIGAQKISSHIELKSYLRDQTFPELFSQPLQWAIKQYTNFTFPAHGYVAEDFIEGDTQVTIEGYAFEGNIYLRGIVDSIMYPGTLSFKRFEYPSRLPTNIQEEIKHLAQTYMCGIGFDNGLFNIEFMYNEFTKKVSIIEINSRMASQYADIYEKVDGINSYQIALELSLGKKPKTTQKKGLYTCGASFVMRRFDDAKVTSIPSNKDVEKVKAKFPLSVVEIIPKPGTMLSDYLQDGNSFRYCLIHLGATSRKKLIEYYEMCKKLLPFSFETEQ